MTSPKLHHYVPRFYLKRFAVRNDRFWVWDKRTEKVFETTPYSVAAEKHFYGTPDLIGTKHDPLIIERQLSELEGNASRITSMWINSFDLLRPMDSFPVSLDERRQMSLFLSVQFLRTAEERDILALFAAERGYYESGISLQEKKIFTYRCLATADWLRQSRNGLINRSGLLPAMAPKRLSGHQTILLHLRDETTECGLKQESWDSEAM